MFRVITGGVFQQRCAEFRVQRLFVAGVAQLVERCSFLGDLNDPFKGFVFVERCRGNTGYDGSNPGLVTGSILRKPIQLDFISFLSLLATSLRSSLPRLLIIRVRVVMFTVAVVASTTVWVTLGLLRPFPRGGFPLSPLSFPSSGFFGSNPPPSPPCPLPLFPSG